MSIQRPAANRFRQLRWKLTLSYTGVTVSALLVVELLLLGVAGVVLIALLNSGLLPALLIEASSVDSAPALRPYLAQTPPDQAGIADWLERVGNLTSLDVPLDFDATEEMLVVGSDGRILGARPPDLLGSDQIGQPLDPGAIPGLADPLQAALAGDEEVDHLYTLASPGEKIVIVVPVWDAAHERVLGALVGLGEVPTIMSLLSDVLPIVGVSLFAFTLVAGLAGTAFGAQASRGLVDRLNALAEATLVWSQGDFTVHVDDPSGDEVGQLTYHLNHMAQQLEHLLATRRDLAVVEERNRLARDLHDSVKQRAFAAAAQIGTARALLKQNPNAAQTHIAEAERLSYELRQELTNLIKELRPAALEGKGLASAVREYTEDWSRQSEITLDLRVQGERSLPLDTEQAIFRIVQEALANIARHSQARTVDIKLAYTSDEIHCVVSDDGVGFDPDRQRSGFGLRSMQERAEALCGNLTIESETGQGVRIVLSAPLGKSPDHDEDLL